MLSADACCRSIDSVEFTIEKMMLEMQQVDYFTRKQITQLLGLEEINSIDPLFPLTQYLTENEALCIATLWEQFNLTNYDPIVNIDSCLAILDRESVLGLITWIFDEIWSNSYLANTLYA